MLCVFKAGGYNVASPNPPVAVPAPFGTVHLTTPTGYPYTYHNGVAYFHNPEPNIHPSFWPAVSLTHKHYTYCQIYTLSLYIYCRFTWFPTLGFQSPKNCKCKDACFLMRPNAQTG